MFVVLMFRGEEEEREEEIKEMTFIFFLIFFFIRFEGIMSIYVSYMGHSDTGLHQACLCDQNQTTHIGQGLCGLVLGK